MPKQRALDLRGDGLFALWRQLPEWSRRDAIVIWARLIARAVQSKKPTRKGKDNT